MRAAVSGLVCGVTLAGCYSADGSPSPDPGDIASGDAAAGQPGSGGEVSRASSTVITSGDKAVALIAVHEAWQLFAALDEQNVDAVAEHLIRLSYRGGDISFGPPLDEGVGSSQSALSEPPALPDDGSASCDAAGCRFNQYLHNVGFSGKRLEGTLRLESNGVERTLQIDLIDDDLDAAFAYPAHISGAFAVTDTTLGGALTEVTPFDEGDESQLVGFSALTFEPGTFLPEATPTSGRVIGAWHSWQHPTQLAILTFP